ncbi:lipase family protein [Rheinheimera tilapiae]|uniref:Fungal lipase-type domain-containing protein n=1 Tax=Rheinheimera tilapiae TaxID=875043 RepID=A0ABV6BHV7_9GAMM
MSGLDMLDAFIGLVGIYLTLSLLVTAIGEGLSQAAGMRGRNLRQVFIGLIGKNRTKEFYLHPRIRQLMQYDAPTNALRKIWLRLGFGLPSYIPADIAIEVLLEQQLGAPLLQLRQSPLEIQQRLERLPSSSTRSSLLYFWQQASADPHQFQTLVQDWFNDRCDRAVGWFKRKLGILQLIIGLGVAIGMNVDSIALYQKLFSDPVARQQAVLLAENLAANPQLASELCREDKASCMDTMALKQQLTQTAPLLGRSADDALLPSDLLTWIGYLLTAFALSLGAPFWFDILQKLMAVKQKFRSGNSANTDEEAQNSAASVTATVVTNSSGTVVALSGNANPVSAMDLQLARLSDLVYLDGPQLELELQSFLLSGTLRSVGEDTQYLYARGADYDVLICRGTEGKLADIRTDAQCPLRPWPEGSNSNAHQGFSAQANVILADLKAQHPTAGLERSLWITGHSLGGALAVLLALQLSKISGFKLAGLVTFGQPKVGDAQLTQAITQQLLPFYRRYVNQRDIVPKLPPLPEYRHSGQLYYFDDLDQLQLNPPRWLMLLDQVLCNPDQAEAALRQHLDDHRMKGYLHLLAKQR